MYQIAAKMTLKKIKKRTIIIPVYYTEVDGKVVIDYDSMREEYEMKIKDLEEAYDN